MNSTGPQCFMISPTQGMSIFADRRKSFLNVLEALTGSEKYPNFKQWLTHTVFQINEEKPIYPPDVTHKIVFSPRYTSSDNLPALFTSTRICRDSLEYVTCSINYTVLDTAHLADELLFASTLHLIIKNFLHVNSESLLFSVDNLVELEGHPTAHEIVSQRSLVYSEPWMSEHINLTTYDTLLTLYSDFKCVNILENLDYFIERCRREGINWWECLRFIDTHVGNHKFLTYLLSEAISAPRID